MARTTIPANPNATQRSKRFSQEMSVILGDDLANYNVEAKDFPGNLPERWTDPSDGQSKEIDWFGNFGIKKRGESGFVNKLPKKYSVELPYFNKQYVYYDGQAVKKLQNVRSAGQNKVQVDLDLGDPPIGAVK